MEWFGESLPSEQFRSPIGALLILKAHELVIVSYFNADPDLLHGWKVGFVSDPVGSTLSHLETVDLEESEPATGRELYPIIKTTDPQKCDIRVSDYLIA